VSTVRKSQASTLRCLRLQERAPRGRGPLRSRWERCFEQHLPYRGRGYADPSSLEFTDESPVAPVRILADERRIIARSDGSSGGRPGPMHICPAVGDELTVPAQQGVRLDREARPRRRGSDRLSAASSMRSARVSFGRGGLPAQDRELMGEDENLEFLRATLPSEQADERSSSFRRTRYTNDQCKQPSLDHDYEQPNLATRDKAADEFADPTRSAECGERGRGGRQQRLRLQRERHQRLPHRFHHADGRRRLQRRERLRQFGGRLSTRERRRPGPLAGCLSGGGVRLDTVELRRSTTFKCTGQRRSP
jgi:hypothetical protein